jgi:phosphatidate cytidylyltransferase
LSAVKIVSGFACAVVIFAVLGIDYFLLHSHLAYFVFFLALLIMSSIELCRIAGVKSRWIVILTAIVIGYPALIFVHFAVLLLLSEDSPPAGLWEQTYTNIPSSLIFIVALLVVPVISRTIRSRIRLTDIAVPLLAVMYVGVFGRYLFLLPFTGKGLVYYISSHGYHYFSHAVLLWFICTTKANDILGYLLGSSIGKRQLNSVSPKKTVEGAVAGLIGGVLISLLVVYLFLSPHYLWKDAILFGIIVGVAAQFGDLAESFIKRLCGVKDSGNLIPGSGGALDFIDCFLFAAPAAYYFLLITG